MKPFKSLDRASTSTRIDLGLKYMVENHPGPHSCETIAQVCGCNAFAIDAIYNKALKKVRARLGKDFMDEV